MTEAIPKDAMLIRPGEIGDKSFIYATWLRGLYYGNSWFGSIDKTSYMKNYHLVIDGLLQKPNVTIQVATLPDDLDVVLGYSVSEPGILHWVFVKQAWRRFGIAKKLIPEGVGTVTHLTQLGDRLKPKEWAFNPFKI